MINHWIFWTLMTLMCFIMVVCFVIADMPMIVIMVFIMGIIASVNVYRTARGMPCL